MSSQISKKLSKDAILAVASRQDILDFMASIKDDLFAALVCGVRAFKEFEYSADQIKTLEQVKAELASMGDFTSYWRDILSKVKKADLVDYVSDPANMDKARELYLAKTKQHNATLENLMDAAYLAAYAAIDASLIPTKSVSTTSSKASVSNHVYRVGKNDRKVFFVFGNWPQDRADYRVFFMGKTADQVFELPVRVECNSLSNMRQLADKLTEHEHTPDMMPIIDQWSKDVKVFSDTAGIGVKTEKTNGVTWSNFALMELDTDAWLKANTDTKK